MWPGSSRSSLDTGSVAVAPDVAVPSSPSAPFAVGDRGALLLIAAWKLATLAVALLAAGLLDPASAFPGESGVGVREALERLEAALRTNWDGRHYITLAEFGYGPYPSLSAFPPLYPLSIRFANVVFGDSLVSALVVANVASTAGLFLVYRLARGRYSVETATLTLVLFLAFPTAFFLNLNYSEGLFLLLTAACFYGLQRRWWWLVVAGAFFLPLLRYTGAFIGLPIALALLLDRRPAVAAASGGQAGSSVESLAARLRAALSWRALLLLAPVAGFVAYLLFMEQAGGDAFAGFSAQHDFPGDKDVRNLLYPEQWLRELFRGDLVLHQYERSLIDRVFFAGFLASVPLMYRRLDPPLFAFCLLLGLVPLFGTYMSYVRYLMPAFGLYIAYGALLAKRPVLVFAAVLAMSLLQALLLSLHVLNHWVA